MRKKSISNALLKTTSSTFVVLGWRSAESILLWRKTMVSICLLWQLTAVLLQTCDFHILNFRCTKRTLMLNTFINNEDKGWSFSKKLEVIAKHGAGLSRTWCSKRRHVWNLITGDVCVCIFREAIEGERGTNCPLLSVRPPVTNEPLRTQLIETHILWDLREKKKILWKKAGTREGTYR